MASASSSSSVSKNAPKEDQLWFFLLEDMPVPSFAQHSRTLSEVRNMDITLRRCLKITNAKGDVNDYAFYIHSQGMSAAVQLLTDESIIATYNLYCRADGLVLIIIRGKDDPSPNISRSSSYAQSLADRRKQSAARGIAVPELPIQPKVRHKTGSADITTMEPITEQDDVVSIRVGDDDFVTFTKDYLLGWLDAELSRLKNPTKIVVQTIGPDGQPRDVPLTAEVWQHSLLRGPWRDAFAGIWDRHIRAQCLREEALADLSTSQPGFRQSCRDFVRDLRAFGDDTRDRLLAVPTASHGGTLESALRALAEKRRDGTICASHDLSPIFRGCAGDCLGQGQ
ncbi:hypothetical protein QBC33DRAFT_573000 [Phialemonium atrogriseum]|uniref:Uncharacterized protein n=1 Tax=Phialemonium atrogriseum TaxID=1093897 RepID=A0AAJ0BSR4_9PEZI|nr:uncharacterized protein QBC33DRAFT_573000 [Phialemonium atrogriseum]KAK1763808.1 hypothetical protein QBC33DRAFT_573000 [Phialemonium atrogriseum]